MVFKASQEGGCGAGHRVYAMNPQGEVRPCVMFDAKKFRIGSLMKEDPDAIFSHPLPAAFSELSPPHQSICGKCRWVLFCQNCMLRGVMGSQWVGEKNCRWMQQPKVTAWYALLTER
jgi:radical SAM protein with 4Fe4S-binding SPASM domain